MLGEENVLVVSRVDCWCRSSMPRFLGFILMGGVTSLGQFSCGRDVQNCRLRPLSWRYWNFVRHSVDWNRILMFKKKKRELETYS